MRSIEVSGFPCWSGLNGIYSYIGDDENTVWHLGTSCCFPTRNCALRKIDNKWAIDVSVYTTQSFLFYSRKASVAIDPSDSSGYPPREWPREKGRAIKVEVI